MKKLLAITIAIMLMMPQQAYALRPMAAKQANNPGPRADNPGPGIKNPGPEETFQEFIDALDTVHIPGLDIAAIKDIIINRRDIRRRLMEITKRLKKQPAGKKLLSQLKPALDALGSLWNGIKSTSKSDKTSSLMIFIRGLESEFEFEGEFAKDDVLKIMKAIASLTGDYAKSKAPPEHEFPEELEEELKTDIFRLNFWAKERVLDVEVVTEVIENRTEAFLNYTDETQKLQLAIRDMDYAKENLFPVVELRFLKAGNEEYIRLTRLNEKQIKLELKGENIWNLICKMGVAKLEQQQQKLNYDELIAKGAALYLKDVLDCRLIQHTCRMQKFLPSASIRDIINDISALLYSDLYKYGLMIPNRTRRRTKPLAYWPASGGWVNLESKINVHEYEAVIFLGEDHDERWEKIEEVQEAEETITLPEYTTAAAEIPPLEVRFYNSTTFGGMTSQGRVSSWAKEFGIKDNIDYIRGLDKDELLNLAEPEEADSIDLLVIELKRRPRLIEDITYEQIQQMRQKLPESCAIWIYDSDFATFTALEEYDPKFPWELKLTKEEAIARIFEQISPEEGEKSFFIVLSSYNIVRDSLSKILLERNWHPDEMLIFHSFDDMYSYSRVREKIRRLAKTGLQPIIIDDDGNPLYGASSAKIEFPDARVFVHSEEKDIFAEFTVQMKNMHGELDSGFDIERFINMFALLIEEVRIRQKMPHILEWRQQMRSLLSAAETYIAREWETEERIAKNTRVEFNRRPHYYTKSIDGEYKSLFLVFENPVFMRDQTGSIFRAREGEEIKVSGTYKDRRTNKEMHVEFRAAIVNIDEDRVQLQPFGHIDLRKLPQTGNITKDFNPVNYKIQLEFLRSLMRYVRERSQEIPDYSKPITDMIMGFRLPVVSPGVIEKVLLRNRDIAYNLQQLAVLSASLNGSSIELCQGPPGTGKTTVSAEVDFQQFVRSEPSFETTKQLLVVAQTNRAVDNLLLKAKASGLKVCRIGNNPNLIDPRLREDWIFKDRPRKPKAPVRRRGMSDEDWSHDQTAHGNLMIDYRERLREWRAKLKENFKENVRGGMVVGGTCMGIAIESLLKNMHFDYVIIEEASVASFTESMLAVSKLDNDGSILLIGDQNQLGLSPMSEDLKQDLYFHHLSHQDIEMLNKSLFQILLEEAIFNMIMLEDCYRMLPNLVGLTNIYYDGRLKAKRVPRTELEDKTAIVFIDTKNIRGNEERSSGFSWENPCEIELAIRCIDAISDAKPDFEPEQLGIITPYSKQAGLTRRTLSERFKPDEDKRIRYTANVGTAWPFQGQERETTIVSLVRSKPKGKRGTTGFIEPNMLNVITSRARDRMFIIANSDTFLRSPNRRLREVFTRMLEYIKENAVYLSPENKSDLDLSFLMEVERGIKVSEKEGAHPMVKLSRDRNATLRKVGFRLPGRKNLDSEKGKFNEAILAGESEFIKTDTTPELIISSDLFLKGNIPYEFLESLAHNGLSSRVKILARSNEEKEKIESMGLVTVITDEQEQRRTIVLYDSIMVVTDDDVKRLNWNTMPDTFVKTEGPRMQIAIKRLRDRVLFTGKASYENVVAVPNPVLQEKATEIEKYIPGKVISIIFTYREEADIVPSDYGLFYSFNKAIAYEIEHEVSFREDVHIIPAHGRQDTYIDISPEAVLSELQSCA